MFGTAALVSILLAFISTTKGNSNEHGIFKLARQFSQYIHKPTVVFNQEQTHLDDTILANSLSFNGWSSFTFDSSCFISTDLVVFLDGCSTCTSSLMSNTLLLPGWCIDKLRHKNLRLDSNVYIYNSTSQGTITVTEIYGAKGVRSYENDIGYFDTHRGLFIPTSSRIKSLRRADLQGLEIKSVFEEYLPVCEFDKEGLPSGHNYWVFFILANHLNFTTKMLPSPGQFGSLDKDGQWTGIVGMLSRKEVDTCSCFLAMSPERQKVIDYTVQIHNIEMNGIINTHGGKKLNLWVFKDSFNSSVWVLYVAALLGMALMLKVTWKVGMVEAMVNVALHFMQLDGTFRMPESLSSRVTYLVSTLIGFITFAAYTALLTATMTTRTAIPEIHSLEEAYEQGYQVIVYKGAIVNSFMVSSPEGTIEHKIYHETLKNNPKAFYLSVQEGKQLLLDNPGYLALEAGDLFRDDPNFTILQAFKDSFKWFASMALQKDSEFKELFDFHLKKMHESGLIQHSSMRWELGRLKAREAQKISSLGYDNVVFPFLVLGTGVALAGLAVVAECLVIIAFWVRFEVKQVKTKI